MEMRERSQRRSTRCWASRSRASLVTLGPPLLSRALEGHEAKARTSVFGRVDGDLRFLPVRGRARIGHHRVARYVVEHLGKLDSVCPRQEQREDVSSADDRDGFGARELEGYVSVVRHFGTFACQFRSRVSTMWRRP